MESIPIDQPEVSLGEISASSKLNEDTVARLLRHASANYVFREPHRGYFAHTGASHMLATNHGIRQWIEMVSEELWPAATKVRPLLPIYAIWALLSGSRGFWCT